MWKFFFCLFFSVVAFEKLLKKDISKYRYSWQIKRERDRENSYNEKLICEKKYNIFVIIVIAKFSI